MENPKHGIENLNFVVYCVKKALEEEASHEVAVSNQVWLDRHFGQAMKLGLSPLLRCLGCTRRGKLMNECDQWKAVTFSDQSEVPVRTSEPASGSGFRHCQAPITGQQASIEQTSEVAKDVQGPPSVPPSVRSRNRINLRFVPMRKPGRHARGHPQAIFSPEGFFILGKIAWIAGDLEKAKVCVDRLSDMTPDWPPYPTVGR